MARQYIGARSHLETLCRSFYIDARCRQNHSMSIVPVVVKPMAFAVALVVASAVAPPRYLSEIDPFEGDDTAVPANAVEFHCLEIVGCAPSP